MMEAEEVTWEAGVSWVGRVGKKRKRCIIAANTISIIIIIIISIITYDLILPTFVAPTATMAK